MATFPQAHSSSPAVVKVTNTSSTISSAAFDPPARIAIVVGVTSDADNNAGAAPTLNAIPGLTWTRLGPALGFSATGDVGLVGLFQGVLDDPDTDLGSITVTANVGITASKPKMLVVRVYPEDQVDISDPIGAIASGSFASSTSFLGLLTPETSSGGLRGLWLDWTATGVPAIIQPNNDNAEIVDSFHNAGLSTNGQIGRKNRTVAGVQQSLGVTLLSTSSDGNWLVYELRGPGLAASPFDPAAFSSSAFATTGGGATTTPVSATRATTWRVRASVSASRATTWRALAAASSLRSTTWDARTAVSATRSTTWRTATSVGASRSTTWDARTSVSAQRSSTWNIGSMSSVSASRAISWNVRAQVTATRSTTWDTTSRISRALAASWDTRTHVSAQRSSAWNVDSTMVAVSAARSTTWRTKARTTAARAASWDTRAATVNTRPTSWDVRTEIASARGTYWRTRALIVAQRVAAWRSLAQVDVVRDSSWSVVRDSTGAVDVEVISVEARWRTVTFEHRDPRIVAWDERPADGPLSVLHRQRLVIFEERP